MNQGILPNPTEITQYVATKCNVCKKINQTEKDCHFKKNKVKSKDEDKDKVSFLS